MLEIMLFSITWNLSRAVIRLYGIKDPRPFYLSALTMGRFIPNIVLVQNSYTKSSHGLERSEAKDD